MRTLEIRNEEGLIEVKLYFNEDGSVNEDSWIKIGGGK